MGMQVRAGDYYTDVITDGFVPNFDFLDEFDIDDGFPALVDETCDFPIVYNDGPFYVVSPGKPCRLLNKQEEAKLDKAPESDFIKKIEFWDIQQAEYPKVPLSDVRKIMDEAANSSKNVIIATTPGSGKTTTIKKRIHDLCKQQKAVLYAAPIKKVVDETYQALDVEKSIRYYARSPKDPKNCEMYDLCVLAMALNQSVIKRVCKIRCKKYRDGTCIYLKQLDGFDNGVIAGTHDAAPFVEGKLLDNGIKFDEMIIDENPRPSMISSDAIPLNEFRLLREGMQDSTWWKKLSAFINENMPNIGEKHYIQIPLCINTQHIEEMNNSGAWEALTQIQLEKDTRQHKEACARRLEENKAHNKQAAKDNKILFKQYKLKKKEYLTSLKKDGVLVAHENYQAFEPIPEKHDMPEFKSNLPRRKTWVKRWSERRWTTRGECPVREIGINGKDIAEAVLRFNDMVDYYSHQSFAINGLEFEFFCAALGMSENDAYIEAREQTIKNDDPDKEDTVIKIIALRVVKQKKIRIDKKRLIILDGTADEEELRALFDCDLNLVKADSELKKTHTVYFEQSFGSRDARFLSKMATRKKKPDDSRLRYLLERSISKLKETDKKVLLLTFKDLSDVLLKLAREIDPGREWVNTHYYGNRGLNEFEDCNAVVAIGTPMVSPVDFIPISMKLFGRINEQWIARQGLRELIQSIHRIRPINHETTIILTGNYFPTEAFGQPDLWVSARRDGKRDELVQRTIDLLTPVAKNLKCLTQEIAGEQGLFDEEDFKNIKKFEENGGVVVLKWPRKKWPEIIREIAKICGLPVVARQQKRGAPRLAAGADRAFVALGRRARRARRAGGLQ